MTIWLLASILLQLVVVKSQHDGRRQRDTRNACAGTVRQTTCAEHPKNTGTCDVQVLRMSPIEKITVKVGDWSVMPGNYIVMASLQLSEPEITIASALY